MYSWDYKGYNACGVLVTYEAIFKPASELASLGLVRRKKGENSEHAAYAGKWREAWSPGIR